MMEALSRKTEKEKLVVLEQMLADATLSGDLTVDDARSVSSGSELHTPMKYQHVPSSPRQDPQTNSPAAWRRAGWNRSGNISSTFDIDARGTQTSMVENMIPREADVTARIYSSSSSSMESSAEEAAVRRHQHISYRRASRHRHRHNRGSGSDRHRTSSTAERDEKSTASTAATVALLRSELEATRSQVEQKEVVTRSLQRQLDQRGDIEEQTQARAEEDLVAALAKASGLKEELTRTSQLLMEGALARQYLEQRCSLLTKDLHRSVTRTSELEDELSVSRAELVRVSGDLHARRGTDVVDAERAFGDELQRVQETAAREARALRQEGSGLRTSLEENKTRFRKACEERDSWREEAEALSIEASTLRETLQALRQYSENDTIDQLLGQVSRWKSRTEELENLQRMASSPERSAFDGSNSEMEASQSTNPIEPLLSPRVEDGAPLGTLDPVPAPHQQQKEEPKELERDKAATNALRQELSEAKENLAMMEEEVAAAVLAAREQAVKRVAAESRVGSLQREAEATARIAREDVIARRAAKARNMANLKLAIRQDMVDELFKLQCEMREQGQEEHPHGTGGASPHTFHSDCSQRPAGVDKACQVDGIIAPSASKGLVVQNDALPRVCVPSSACGVDSSDSTANGVGVVTSPAGTAVLEKEAAERISAAMTSAAVAQNGATAWASAFSGARQLFHAALVSLCEQVTGVLAAESEEQQAFVVPLLTGVEPSEGSSNAVVPWVPGEAKTEAAIALEALRDSLESAVEGIRGAAGRTTRTAVTPQLTVTTVSSQTALEPPTTEVITVSWTTIGLQTDEGLIKDGAHETQRQDVGVQTAGLVGRSRRTVCGVSGASEAPAWEGDIDKQCFEGEDDDGDQDLRRKLKKNGRVEELERTTEALSEALQRAEAEKGDLEQSLARRFESEKALQLKNQRDMYEADIAQLHASTMALVHDFSCGSNGIYVAGESLVRTTDCRT